MGGIDGVHDWLRRVSSSCPEGRGLCACVCARARARAYVCVRARLYRALLRCRCRRTYACVSEDAADRIDSCWLNSDGECASSGS